MFKVQEHEDYTNIDFQSLRMSDVIEFCEKINQMFKDGYCIATDVPPRLVPKIPRVFNLRFVKEESTEEEELVEVKEDPPEVNINIEELDEIVEVTKEEDSEGNTTISIDVLTKKDELLEYAEKKGYEIPPDLKLPSQIKKYIKETYEA